MASAERSRVEGFGQLENGLRQASEWYLWGPYLSERQWGTVREDYSEDGDAWAYLPHDHARSRAYRWGEDGMAGFSRRRAAPLPRAGPVERAGPDPEGADVRPDRGPGQPRRGREGVLVVPRRPPQPCVEPVALPLPAGRLPVRRPDRRERPAGQARPRVRAARHRRLRRRPLLDRRGRLRQGRSPRPADGGQGHQRRSGRRHAARAAHGVVPQHLVVGRRRAEAGAARRARRRGRHRPPVPRRPASWSPAPARTARRRSRCSARTRPTPSASSARRPRPPYPKDGINDHVVHGASHGEPRSAGDEGGLLAPAGRRARGHRRAAAAAASGCRGAGRRAAQPRSAPTSTTSCAAAGPRPTSSTPS